MGEIFVYITWAQIIKTSKTKQNGPGKNKNKQKSSKGPKESQNSCSLCGKKFSQKQSLIRHNKSLHLKIKDVKCVLCPKTFSSKDILKYHIKSIHKEVSEFAKKTSNKAIPGKNEAKQNS